jgi:hypothetical protein
MVEQQVQFVKCDGGRSLSTIYPTLRGRWVRREGMRFKLVQDCAVRAVSTAFGISYDHAYEILEAEDSGGVWDCPEKLEGETINGWTIRPYSRPSKMTRIEFSKLFPSGRFVCVEHGGRHLVAYIDGVRYDEGLPPDLWRMSEIWKLVPVTKMPVTKMPVTKIAEANVRGRGRPCLFDKPQTVAERMRRYRRRQREACPGQLG